MVLRLNPTTGRLDLVRDGAVNPTINISVPAGQTVTIDTNVFSILRSVTYLINIHKADFTQVKSFKMSLVRVGSDVFDSIYSRVGNNLDCAIVSSVVGPNAIIQVTNNEAFSVTCSFNKDFIN